MPVSFLLLKFCSGISKKYYQKQAETEGKLSGWLFDTINSLIDIRLLSGERKINSDYLRQKEKYIKIRKSATKIETLTQIGTEGTAVLLKILLYGFSAVLVLQRELLIGNFISVIEYFNSSLSIFNEIANRANPITENMVAIERVRDLISTPLNTYVPETFTSAASDLHFENIRFKYEERGPWILDNISFHIGQGEHVVFAGESGCGKTTITRLIMNLYRPDSGTVYIGGREIMQNRDLNLSAKAGVVFQTTAIFDGSIRYNLIFSDSGDRDDEIWLVLERVGLADHVNSLSEGLSAELSGFHTRLSGGQIQRIGIARTLLKNTDIIIFDEPTAAFDQKSERNFLEMCETFYRQKTVIMISHRIETLKAADRIFFLKSGKIEAVGRHENLLSFSAENILRKERHPVKNRFFYFRQFSAYMGKRKTDLYIWFFFQLFIKISALASPFIYVQLIDKIMVGGQIRFLKYVIASILIVYILTSTAKIASWKFHNRFFLSFEKNLQNTVLNKYLDMPVGKILQSDSGNLKKIITEDVNAVLTLVENNMIHYLLSIVIMVSLSILLFAMSPILAVAACVFVPLSFWVTKRIGGKAERLAKEIRSIQGEYEGMLYNLLENWEFIKYNKLFTAVIGKAEDYWFLAANSLLSV